VHRPAAIDQLEVLGKSIGVEVHRGVSGDRAEEIARGGLERARADGFDPVIVDTAGRLHIDEEMMQEVTEVKRAAKPHEVLFVADAMTGQDAVQSAEAFDKALGLDGVVLTKMDGDARGGAAISIRAVTGKPIKFIGVGEKLNALESFHPDRVASRILGMGDVVSLVEKAQSAVDEEEAVKLAEKIKKQAFTLDDFRTQLRYLRKMGPLEQILGMIPGLGSKMKGLTVDEKALVRIEAIINSMTPQERSNPKVINGSRRKRIARGSGTSVQEVNQLLRQFTEMKKMLKRLKSMGMGRKGLTGLPF
jgi:signal recognition particle subunit SRP54